MAMEVKLLQPVKVVCTDDLGETLVDIMQTAGYSRPLMVTDSFVGSMPLVVAARTKLEQVGVDVAVFDQVKPDPLCETVESGVEAFEAHKADSIIAIGGGSSMDVARGINIVRVNGGSIIEYTDPAKPIAPCNGMIAVPTTAGTGSEMSNALVVTEGSTGRKLAVLADPAVSEYAVLNADLMLTLPAKMTIACGLDAFCHAAEGYLSRMASPVADAIAKKRCSCCTTICRVLWQTVRIVKQGTCDGRVDACRMDAEQCGNHCGAFHRTRARSEIPHRAR